ITQARTGKAAPRRPPANNPPGGIYPCKPGGPNDYVYLLTSHANPEHWPRLLKLIEREDLICDARYETPDARMKCEAEVDEIVASWTRQRTKHEAMAQLSAVGVPAGAVLDTQELIDEPSFRQRGILQTMTHGERKMTMPTWPVRFDGVPSEVKSMAWAIRPPIGMIAPSPAPLTPSGLLGDRWFSSAIARRHGKSVIVGIRSEEHTSELQSHLKLVCPL